MATKEGKEGKAAALPKKRNYRRRTPKQNSGEQPAKQARGRAKTVTRAAAFSAAQSRSNHKQEVRRTPVRIIPLGGLNEIGKNMTVFECSNDMFILDCGLAFPDGDMPGVDIVIPDFTYVEAIGTRCGASC